MRALKAPTMTALHDLLCDRLVHATPDKLDVISSVDVQIHDVIAQADSMQWDFDFKSMWLTKSRWSMMCRQYIDPQDFISWLTKSSSVIGKKGRGICMLRTKEVKARGGAATGHTNKETRRWGSCMLGISYKARPRPQITLHSRTSYLGYIGALDLSVAWMAGQYVADAVGLDVQDLSFVWMNEAIQWHNFKSLAYLLNHKDPERRQEYRRLMLLMNSKLEEGELETIANSPALKLSRDWMQKLRREDLEGKTYGDMSYNTYRRIRRRYHTEVFGFEKAQKFEGWSHYKKGEKEGEQKEYFSAYKPLPHVLIGDLDFSPLGLPRGSLSIPQYDPDLAAQMEDEDDD